MWAEIPKYLAGVRNYFGFTKIFGVASVLTTSEQKEDGRKIVSLEGNLSGF